MSYLARYLAGEHQAVWAELTALGAGVRDDAVAADARAVAHETMSRVRRNLRLLEERLRALGYEFGVYPDGERPSGYAGPLADPSPAVAGEIEGLQWRAGPLPLSLEAFWTVVGSVSFIGRHPAWPDGADPLVVDPPEGALADLDDWEARREEDGDEEVGPFVVPIAPDALHKDNVSGGEPYGVMLSDAGADARVVHEPHGVTFVEYLRLVILEWGGFPGYDCIPAPPPERKALTDGLEPF